MATTKAEQALEAAVRGVFHRWTGLTLILEMHDDPRRARATALAMADTVRNMATRGDDIFAIADIMYDALDEINVDLEDGSVEQVAKMIVDVRNAAARGDFGPASLLAIAPAHRQQVLANSVEMKGENSDAPGAADDDGCSASSSQRQPRAAAPVDDDGFTTVVRR